MKILCFGEILYDEINGQQRLGGAPLNLAAHLSKLGQKVYLVSGIGSDKAGEKAIEKIKKLGIKTDFIRTIAEYPTGLVKVSLNPDGVPQYNIVKNQAYDRITVDNETKKKLLSGKFDCFCFGTLAQRSKISRNTLAGLFKIVKAKTYFCDLNLRWRHYTKNTVIESLKQADILKVNEDEARYLRALLGGVGAGHRELFCRLNSKFSLKAIVVTRGATGCAAFSEKETVELGAVKTKAQNTVGAGDAFSAAFLSEYLVNNNLKKACQAANRLGAKIAARKEAF